MVLANRWCHTLSEFWFELSTDCIQVDQVGHKFGYLFQFHDDIVETFLFIQMHTIICIIFISVVVVTKIKKKVKISYSK